MITTAISDLVLAFPDWQGADEGWAMMFIAGACVMPIIAIAAITAIVIMVANAKGKGSANQVQDRPR